MSESMLQFTDYATSEQLEANLCHEVIARLQTGITHRGCASMVVSGGRTPVTLFQRLSHNRLNWEKVTITLADERWVATDHAASNERLVREHLLRAHAAKARFVGLKNDQPSPELGADRTSTMLADIPSPFDVVLLGMGEDGHTASLFPDAPELQQALALDSELVCSALNPASSREARLSLTLPMLLNSRYIALQLEGEAKHTTYQRALTGTNITEMPIRAVLQQERVPVSVNWTMNSSNTSP